MEHYYQQQFAVVASSFHTDQEKGISTAEAKSRLEQYGPNQLTEKRSKPLVAIFFSQFKDFLIMILLLAAVISGFLGEWQDASVILLIVLVNAAIGTSQEAKAEKAIAALKRLALPQVTVLRDGDIKKIAATELVPGDIVSLEAGAFVPADLRLQSAVNLKIDESTLTGESVTVDKQDEPLAAADLPVADQKNMAFSGTVVTYGRGRGLVVGTGMKTELGKIAELIAGEKEEKTPLEQKFEDFGKWLGGLALGVCGLIFVVGYLEGEAPLQEMFLTSVSLAVAAIPEGLPAVVTISLALGAYRLVARRAIIRKLPAVETLGSVTVICSDKTGTLTQNKMTVEEVVAVSDRPLLLMGGALCNDATLTVGDPTEIALVAAAERAGLKKEQLNEQYPRLLEIPFDSKTKRMTTLHKAASEAGFIAFTKGALDVILELCVSLGPDAKKQVLAEAERLAANGRRVLAVACKRYAAFPDKLIESDLTYLGFLAMVDPIRPEVKEAVANCRTAGIRPVMITGDHRLTALAVARELGITEQEAEVIEGRDLAGRDLTRYRVFARVSPEHKLDIVNAFRAKGEIVAMTGDGVNDAPALKASDIGIAMGIAGTDVAKEASDMVLTDDNFATIVGAIEEGRGIFDNILKFVRYILTTNSGEILTMLLAIVFRLPLPLLPIQILWINLVTDGLPALALTMEPIEKDIMRRQPRKPSESITGGGLLGSMVGIGVLMAAITIGLFQLGVNVSLAEGRTMAFAALSFLQMAHVLNCKSLRHSLFETGLGNNLYLVGAIALTGLLQYLVTEIGWLQRIFYTVSLDPAHWAMVIGLSLLPIVAVELRKRFRPA
ncbi:MAG: cation-translocating P-type ATPase [Candidatus Margulisbacteria bacterium]|jgi:Ca2+-transporting ATPase|nr:cation-translocating P-type ATPase [Candidatus Margulisiibacteriota bacterium]